MPCDGAIGVAEDGFVVHIQSRKHQLVPAPAVDSSALSPRQRFTLAHEISHTFFYGRDLKRVRPHPSERLLEDSCNYAAGRLLLPEDHRSPHKDGGEFVSRCLVNERAKRQILLESRLEASARRTRKATD